MPLYERKTDGEREGDPERVRTVADSAEDERLTEDEGWQLVDESSESSSPDDAEKSGDASTSTSTASDAPPADEGTAPRPRRPRGPAASDAASDTEGTSS